MSDLLEKIAASENISRRSLEDKISRGVAVVPANRLREDMEIPCGIGEGLSVKVNANIGASPGFESAGRELSKLHTAVRCGADTVMDLTIGAGWRDILARVIDESPVPVGTVPVYGAVCRSSSAEDMSASDFLRTIAEQAEMGVDFMTIHAGVNRNVIAAYDDSRRLGGIVSRGGKIIYRWMKKNALENPLYELFDEILDIAGDYSITLSLGDGLRPGALADASDKPQYAELRVLGELAGRCRDKGVQVMIEGPGHVPLHLIEENVRMEKEICSGAPFYVLGPLTTDLGAGYDHITGAIGGAIAGWMGADFLCYLTPAEHLHLPDERDVALGVISSRIAAHSADIARDPQRFRKKDDEMSAARRRLDWDRMSECALDPDIVAAARGKYPQRADRACTMCGEYCALLD